MFSSGSRPSLINCIFSGNYATRGGGIFNDASSPMLTNCTFTGNSNGMFNTDFSSPTIKNSILWNNGSPEVTNEDSYSVPSYSNTVVEGQNKGTGVFDGNTDPLFVNAALPAGADGIFGTADDGLALRPCSPAQNMGDNSFNTNTLDLAGQPRIFSTTIDLGAYDYFCVEATDCRRHFVVGFIGDLLPVLMLDRTDP